MKAYHKKSIILFDGVCNLCNSTVNFVIKHDKKQRFLFASLQSDAATKLLLQLNFNISEMNTIVLIEDGKMYKKSTAVLRIARQLDSFWYLFYHLIYLPKGLRDVVYDLVANNRYKWFGKSDHCSIETSKTQKGLSKYR